MKKYDEKWKGELDGKTDELPVGMEIWVPLNNDEILVGKGLFYLQESHNTIMTLSKHFLYFNQKKTKHGDWVVRHMSSLPHGMEIQVAGLNHKIMMQNLKAGIVSIRLQESHNMRQWQHQSDNGICTLMKQIPQDRILSRENEIINRKIYRKYTVSDIGSEKGDIIVEASLSYFLVATQPKLVAKKNRQFRFSFFRTNFYKFFQVVPQTSESYFFCCPKSKFGCPKKYIAK